MTRYSKLTALLLTLALATAAACSGGSDEAATTEPPAATAAESTPDDTEPAPPDTIAEPATTVAGRSGGDGAGGESIVVEEVPGFGFEIEPQPMAEWTYLVYSLADTNLEEPMLADVAEMAGVGSGEGVNVVAFVDREVGFTDQPLLNLDDWDTAKLLYVNQQELIEIADIGEVDMADPNVLASFIQFGINTFPAENYALTISDHGGGWTGIGPDESSGEVLDLQELASALSAGLATTDVERVDLLGFDACLMATYEVASSLAPYADYLLASEELEPGHGWDYARARPTRRRPARRIRRRSVSAFVEGFAGQAAASGTDAEITLSLLDLAEMPALDDALGNFAGVLTDQVDALGVVVGRQRASNVSYGRSPDPSQSTHLTDLGEFVSVIGVESLQVSDDADAVLRALNDVVIAQTVGPARLGSTGMSIYFPPTVEYSNGEYTLIPAAEAWTQFLIAYYQSGQAIPPEAQPAIAGESRSAASATPSEVAPLFGSGADAGTVVTGDADIEIVDEGVQVSVQLEPASLPNVVEASLSFGYIDPDDGAIVQLGDTQAEILDDGTVVGITDLTVLTLTDADGDTLDAYLSLEFNEDRTLGFASVPLDYSTTDGEVIDPVDLTIVVDAVTGDVLQEIYYLIDEAAGSYGELNADPAALIRPVVLVYLQDGSVEWQSFGDDALFADLPTLQYGFEEIDPSLEIYVDITVTDYGGNELIASANFFLE